MSWNRNFRTLCRHLADISRVPWTVTTWGTWQALHEPCVPYKCVGVQLNHWASVWLGSVVGKCPPTNLKSIWWCVCISQDRSEPLSNEDCSNTSDSSPLFYKSKHFLRTNLESLISLTAQSIWHVCFHPHVFYKVLMHMLRLKALYEVFGISRTRVFPGRRAQEAFLGPLVRHWWSQWAPGGDDHSCSRMEEAPTPGEKWHHGGTLPQSNWRCSHASWLLKSSSSCVCRTKFAYKAGLCVPA